MRTQPVGRRHRRTSRRPGGGSALRALPGQGLADRPDPDLAVAISFAVAVNVPTAVFADGWAFWLSSHLPLLSLGSSPENAATADRARELAGLPVPGPGPGRAVHRLV
jgi:hypothetical protein